MWTTILPEISITPLWDQEALCRIPFLSHLCHQSIVLPTCNFRDPLVVFGQVGLSLSLSLTAFLFSSTKSWESFHSTLFPLYLSTSLSFFGDRLRSEINNDVSFAVWKRQSLNSISGSWSYTWSQSYPITNSSFSLQTEVRLPLTRVFSHIDRRSGFLWRFGPFPQECQWPNRSLCLSFWRSLLHFSSLSCGIRWFLPLPDTVWSLPSSLIECLNCWLCESYPKAILSEPLELAISSLSVIGVAVMGILSGFGVINFPAQNLPFLMRRITNSDIQRCHHQLLNTVDQILQNKKEILRHKDKKVVRHLLLSLFLMFIPTKSLFQTTGKSIVLLQSLRYGLFLWEYPFHLSLSLLFLLWSIHSFTLTCNDYTQRREAREMSRPSNPFNKSYFSSTQNSKKKR